MHCNFLTTNLILDMKNLVNFFLLVVAIVISSCTSDIDVSTNDVVTEDMPIIGHVSREVSCEILNGVLAKTISLNSVFTRNRHRYVEAEDARAYNSQGELLTRAGEDEAYFYVFDIDDEGGYAIMGANTVVPPLLVIAAGSPNLNQNDTSKLRNDLANLPNDFSFEDTVAVEEEYVKHYNYRKANYELVNNVAPITLKWGTVKPWNVYNPAPEDQPDDEKNAANNCSCIAMAMILSSENYRPSQYDGQDFFNWDLISSYEYLGVENEIAELNGVIDEVAYLIYRLSDETLLNVTSWNRDVSWNPSGRQVEAFANLGYEVTRENYDFGRLMASVTQGYPVFMEGYDGGGHAWVCSAALEATVPYYYAPKGSMSAPDEDTPIFYETQYLFHHNWGWKGDANGYYFASSIIQSGEGALLDDSFNVLRNIDRHHGYGSFNSIKITIDSRVI